MEGLAELAEDGLTVRPGQEQGDPVRATFFTMVATETGLVWLLAGELSPGSGYVALSLVHSSKAAMGS